MKILVNRLIAEAFYYLGEWNKNDTIPGWAMQEACDLLNQMLATWKVETLLIPYLQTVEFNFVAGQSVYTFSKVITHDVYSSPIMHLYDVSYLMSGTVYPIKIVDAGYYYNLYRTLNVQALSQIVFPLQEENATVLTFYPIPSQAYACRVRGKFPLSNVGLNDEIDELPDEYFNLLKMGLASELSEIYETANWSDKKESKLKELKKNIKGASYKDLWVNGTPANYLTAYDRVRGGI
jgi:hypothetical protein